MSDVGKNLRAERARRGWSQSALASLAGVHRDTIWAMEQGKRPRPGTLSAVADALGVSVDVLDPETQQSEAPPA